MPPPSWDTVVAETSDRFGRAGAPFTVELQPHPGEVRRARAFIRANYPTAAGQLDTVLLLVSELITNAVLHGRSSVRMTMTVYAGGGVLIGVSDDSSALPRQRSARRDDVDGRGLQIVRELSDDWGFVSVGPAGGKIVWFRIAQQALPAEPASAGSCDGGPAGI